MCFVFELYYLGASVGCNKCFLISQFKTEFVNKRGVMKAKMQKQTNKKNGELINQLCWCHSLNSAGFLIQAGGSGLSSLLPQPKNMTVKEADRPLIPHALTKRQEPKGTRPGAPAQSLLGSSASPSAIKAAAKSAALHLARQIASEDQDEEDITPQNYFSLGENTQPPSAAVPTLDSEPGDTTGLLPFMPAAEAGQSDAPLDFRGNHEGEGAWGGQYSEYEQPMAGPEALQPVRLTHALS